MSAALNAEPGHRSSRPDDPLGVLPLLDAAVAAVGGVPRPGQQEMAAAVAEAASRGRHLLVQAGTGTGKSLAYLVPAVAQAVRTQRPVVVSTATLALQAQVVDRDLPRVADALAGLLGRRPTWQLVKGRRNYLCRQKLEGGFPPEEDLLFDLPVAGAAAGSTGTAEPSPTSRLGREVVRLREWGEGTRSGDRDELVPGVSERAWRQVSVSAEECLGAQRCPLAADCHSEQARERAHHVDVVVSNHAFVAIDAFEGRQMLPEHELLIVDEAHELADRVTSVISDELTEGAVDAAAKRARRAGAADTGRLQDAGAMLAAALDELPDGRITTALPEFLVVALSALRDAARGLLTSLKGDPSTTGPDGGRQVARAAVQELFEVADRLVSGPAAGAQSAEADSGAPRAAGASASASGAGSPEDGGGGPADDPDGVQGPGRDVVWVSRIRRSDGVERVGLHVAPLSVAGMLRERLFAERTVVLTSATLTPGGGFDATAGAVGLRGTGAPPWRGLDVGSPFDYPRQGILYVARHLSPPGRDGLSDAALDELASLMAAAGGRTLGLFSSRRAAEYAAERLREQCELPILCQGDDATPTLVREFARDTRTCLFGTLSLWQGVDVPGSACQLVVVDRIPFPRPDDPLAAARQQAVARAGGNGFMAVAATHAALLLAQGTGRLIRAASDRGVVAVLDSRLAAARYGGFLRASLPPFWSTTDREVVLDALRRIDAAAPPPLPVADPVDRAGDAADSPVPSARSSRSAVRAGRGWTAAEDAVLRAGITAGEAAHRLADRVGCSGAQVLARLADLGLAVVPTTAGEARGESRQGALPTDPDAEDPYAEDPDAGGTGVGRQCSGAGHDEGMLGLDGLFTR
ncbi:MAG TPA: ATP-dependent DNA helicase [Kineosporiaceae bacterium]|nr:ATP-dependent DNA helicase [Kineosporiaceae bacterium]